MANHLLPRKLYGSIQILYAFQFNSVQILANPKDIMNPYHCSLWGCFPYWKQQREKEWKLVMQLKATLYRPLCRNREIDSSELTAMHDITREYIKELSIMELQAVIHLRDVQNSYERFLFFCIVNFFSIYLLSFLQSLFSKNLVPI